MELSLRSIRKNIAALSVVALLTSLLVVSSVAYAGSAADTYPDVIGDGSEWYEADTDWGLDNGVLDPAQAYFRAGDNASRAEFFKMVAAGAGIPEAACDEIRFPDLDASHWGCGWITALSDAGVVSGDGAGSVTPGYVRPNDNILRAEAAKVVVEGFGLTGDGTLGSDVWTDSDPTQWYDNYMGIAWYNCVFRGVDDGPTVEPGRNIVRAEAIAVVNRGANPTTDCQVIVAAGALTLELAGTNPGDELVPLNVANHLFAAFTITASPDEDVELNTVILSLNNLGTPDDFDAVRLYLDGVQIGGDKTINSSTRQVTFSLPSTVIAAGTSAQLQVRANLDALAAGSFNQLCIDSSTDVTATGADSLAAVVVGGAFPMCGGIMQTTNAAVGDLHYELTQPDISDITIGTTSQFAEIRLEMQGEAGELTSITFRQTGSADPEDFGNLVLMLGATVIADSSQGTWEGDYLTFDLNTSPLELLEGSPKTIALAGDVIGGLGSDVQFTIQREWHIEGLGQSSYGVNVIDDSIAVLAYRDIIGGNIAFAAAGPPAGDVASGADDFTFLFFNISTLGEAITINELTIAVTCAGTCGPVGSDDLRDIDDVRIWKKTAPDTWVLVAGPEDFQLEVVASVEQTLTESIYVDGATTTEFKITADIANVAATGDDYIIDVIGVNDPAKTEIEYPDTTLVDVTTEVGGTDLLGKAQMVNTPEVTITTSATPGDKTYVPSSGDMDLGAWDFVASTADDLTINTVTIDCDGTGMAEECSNAFNSLYLVDVDTGFMVSTIRNMSFVVAGNGEVTFSGMNVSVPAGQSTRLLLKGTLSGSVVPADSYDLIVDGAAAKDSTSASALVVLPVTVRVITIAPNGNLTLVPADDSSTSPHGLLADSTDQAIMRVKFEADQIEPWIIDDLSLDLTDLTVITGMTEEVDAANIAFYDKTDTFLGETGYQPFANGTALFNNVGIVVPGDPNDPVYAVVYGRFASEIDGGVSGDDIQMELFVDNTYGAISSFTGAVGPELSQFHYYYNSLPVLALDPSSPEDIAATGTPDYEVMILNITNDVGSASDYVMDDILLNANGTCGATAFMLYDSSNNPMLSAPATFGVAVTGGAFTNLAGISLNPGDTEQVSVKADTGGCTGDQNFSITLADFTWDDGSAALAYGTYNIGVQEMPLSSNGFLFK